MPDVPVLDINTLEGLATGAFVRDPSDGKVYLLGTAGAVLLSGAGSIADMISEAAAIVTDAAGQSALNAAELPALRGDLASVAEYTGTELVPVATDREGNVLIGIDTATGLVRLALDPNDQRMKTFVALALGGFSQLTMLADTPLVHPIAVDRNGNVLLGIDLATGAVVPSLSAINNDPAYDSVVAFGDSFTVGSNATAPEKRWANILAAAWGATLLNQAISGTVLQNSNDSGGSPRTNNGRNRFATALTGSNIRSAVLLAYGFNDARYTAAPATLNVANYQNDLAEVVAGLIIRGYRAEDIWLLSPYYITDTGLLTGTTGFSGQTRGGFEAFVAAARAVAFEFGTRYCDTYAWMLANGAGDLIDVDNIHPHDRGHEAIALGVRRNSKVINHRAAPGLPGATSPSAGQIDLTWRPVFGAASYDHQYSASGDVWSAASNASGSTKNWSGLSAGTYQTRVRAVFGDGVKSPWSFAAPVVVS